MNRKLEFILAGRHAGDPRREWHETPHPTRTPAWQLAPYTKNTQVWVCPSRRRGAPDPSVTKFISYGFNNTNHRFQTQAGKHLSTVNVVYADGHAKNTRTSRLIWGNSYGVFSGNYKDNGVSWDAPVAPPYMDSQESTVP